MRCLSYVPDNLIQHVYILAFAIHYMATATERNFNIPR